MMNGYRVEYSTDKTEVCITPDPFIPIDDFTALVKAFDKKGYKWWLPADDRKGYIFSKTNKFDCNQGE